MDTKLLLTKVVSLFYAEAKLGTRNEDVLTVGRQIINGIDLPNVGSENDYNREIIEGLLETSTWLINAVTSGATVLREDFLQRITMNSQGEGFLVDAVRPIVEKDEDKAALETYREQQLHDLDHHQQVKEIDQIIGQARRQLMFDRGRVERGVFARNLIERLEPHTKGGGSSKGLEDLGVMQRISVSDVESAQASLKSEENEEGSTYVFRFGWQGLNRMFGGNEGLKRQEMLCVSALSHNYKSGFTLNMFRQAAMYNKPMPSEDGRKPMLLHISYEQSVNENYRQVYAQLKLNETGENVINDKLDIDEVSAYVKERLETNGWTIEFVRVDPDNTNFRKLFALVEYYEKLGYEICLCVIDYLNKLSKEGCTQGAIGFDVKNLYSRTRNFFNKKNIALITAHQMSGEAMNLYKMGYTDQLVNEVAGKGYYDGCRGLHQELDMEIYCHIVELPGHQFYLTFRRGKHRVTGITPHRDLYCVYKFAENLAPGFADDVLGVDRSMKKPGDDQTDHSGSFLDF